jgi:hypothetical protein
MFCAEHGCPTDQCAEFRHVEDECDPTQRAYVKGLARGLLSAFQNGVSLNERRTEIMMLLQAIRERL